MELSWIAAALASTIIYAGVTVGDKLILTRLGIRLPAFYIFTGANQAIISLLIFAFDPPRGVPLYAALAGYRRRRLLGSRDSRSCSGGSRESRCRESPPVWHTSPIFVAIMAVFFLGESLGWAQWLAIALVVFGAIAISMRSSDLGIGFGIRPTFLVILLGAFLIGMGQLLLKEGSADQSIWSLMAFRGTGPVYRYVRAVREAALLRRTGALHEVASQGRSDHIERRRCAFRGQSPTTLGYRSRTDLAGERCCGLSPCFRPRHHRRHRPVGQEAAPGRGDDTVGRGAQGDGDGCGRSGSSDNRRCVSRDSSGPMSFLAYKTTEPSPATCYAARVNWTRYAHISWDNPSELSEDDSNPANWRGRRRVRNPPLRQLPGLTCQRSSLRPVTEREKRTNI